MKRKILTILGVIAFIGLIFSSGCDFLTNHVTVTINDASTLNPSDCTLKIGWGPNAQTIEGTETVYAPEFPYKYRILDFTNSENFVVVALLDDNYSSRSAEAGNFIDTSEKQVYLVTLTLEDN